MGLLIFLPFILKGKGASLSETGLALVLVFAGGAAGKFICGWLGARIGVLWSVVFTEMGTAAAIILVLILPLPATWIMLPLLQSPAERDLVRAVRHRSRSCAT